MSADGVFTVRSEGLVTGGFDTLGLNKKVPIRPVVD
ncbi:hypothetical protein OR37_01037 [Caulobacter vibrioides OR37]|jgi:hypothetical protein|uniref:Uncharacterized protein n=1 Tax=Caulobacter vibrioides OR37 TaxID=1292034 RepID=R0EBJ4_CAUVI|nr:hypothetical protein OR37_01037 [Caulobacter vibrioides OR37]